MCEIIQGVLNAITGESAKGPIGHKDKGRDRNGLSTKPGRLRSSGSHQKQEETRNRLSVGPIEEAAKLLMIKVFVFLFSGHVELPFSLSSLLLFDAESFIVKTDL